MDDSLYYRKSDSKKQGVSQFAPLLDVYIGKKCIGTIMQTKRNLPDGASADRFFLSNPDGIEVSATDAYTLFACLEKIDLCLKYSCPPRELLEYLV